MNKKLIVVAVLVILIPATVYAASPLFFSRTIDEGIPMVKTDAGKEMQNDEAMQPMVSALGTFVGVGDGIHSAEGTARVLSTDNTKFLRFEDFKATNGPDLHVYLATDEKATEYVDLGALKANIGNQNYQIPEGTDLSKYDMVLVWCKQFSVLFGHADLS